MNFKTLRLIALYAVLSFNIACGETRPIIEPDSGSTSDVPTTTDVNTPDTTNIEDMGKDDVSADVAIGPCGEDQAVQNNRCIDCPAGTTQPAGDDPTGANTSCLATLCPENNRVQDNACVSCEPGSIKDSGDDASGQNSQCNPILCLENARVQEHLCVPCAGEATNDVGDDASGPNTFCDDVCFKTLGVSCAVFEQSYVKASTSNPFTRFGGAVALQGDTMVVGSIDENGNAKGVNGDETNNTASFSGAVYVFVRNGATWSQQAYLKASNTDFNDKFGASVSISGDTIVVGATGESSAAMGVDGDQLNNNAQKSGAAYVFARTGGQWSQQAYLKASNTGALDSFGSAVSIDGNTIAVGAYWEDSSLTGVNNSGGDNGLRGNSGSVYIFARQGNTWSQQAYLKASTTKVGAEFGFCLTLQGDTLAVGAPRENSSAVGIGGDEINEASYRSGAVYVFRLTGGLWAQEAFIKASNNNSSDEFGWSLDLDGDSLIVGAPGESSNATVIGGDELNNDADKSGAAYVFARQGGTWAQQMYLKASNTRFQGSFGYSVSLLGDRAVVGSSSESSAAVGVQGDQTNTNANQSGAVYLFNRAGNNWSQQAYLKASNTGTGDMFGNAVALDGNTLVVGALNEASAASGIDGDQTNNLAQDTGAVYVRQISP